MDPNDVHRCSLCGLPAPYMHDIDCPATPQRCACGHLQVAHIAGICGVCECNQKGNHELNAKVYQMPEGDWAASADWPCTVSDGFSSELDAWKWVARHYEQALIEADHD